MTSLRAPKKAPLLATLTLAELRALFLLVRVRERKARARSLPPGSRAA